MAGEGGYGECMAAPARKRGRIPEGVSDLEAAIATDAIATPFHACKEEAKIGPGDQVLVVGAGGGGRIHAVPMARLCGGSAACAGTTARKPEMITSARPHASTGPRA